MDIEPREKYIQSQILDYLHLRGIKAWRNNTGGYRSVDKFGRKHYYKYGEVGSSDIIGCYKGKFLAIEVKRPSGKVTEAQQAFIDDINGLGGIGIIARCLEDVSGIIPS